MQKKYVLSLLVLLLIFSGGIYIFYKGEGRENINTVGNTKEETTNSGSKNSAQDPQKKIEELRKRYAVKGLILEGENYLSNDLYALALKKFLEAAKENPNELYITTKIAESYFEMHKYTLAYKYYHSIGGKLPDDSKEKKVLSLIYQTNFTKSGSIDSVLPEIKEMGLSEDEVFYYLTSLSCLHNFHECKKIFGEKLFAEKVEEVSTSSGSEVKETKEGGNKNLENIKKAIESYTNFQSEDILYKDALILGAFVQNKLYPVAIELGKKLLEEKADYKPVLKIIAQSYFEMGNYTSAKTYLEKFIELDQKDKTGYYFMGIIQYHLREFILSNIFLNKALDLGFEPKINIKRRIIYNYFELEQTEKMLSELRSLVYDEKEYTEKDLYLSIFYHIIHDKIDVALEIAEYGLQKFKDNGEIYGYIGLIYKEKGDIVIAEEKLKKGLEFSSQSPFILLNLGQLYVAKGEKQKSIIYFKKTIKNDKGGEFGKQATLELEAITSNTGSINTKTTSNK